MNQQCLDRETTKSYYENRLKELEIPLEDITVSAKWRDNGKYQQMRWFYPKDENIDILYLDPHGYVQEYEHEGKLKQFIRTRLACPTKGHKYSQPYSSGIFPYITPGIIKKVQKKETIDTLFITEGEFKAFAGGYHLGLDIIGIGGIQSFVDKKINELHPDISKILTICKVKSIVLLFDADCMDITDDFDKDLYKRPYSFYSAVKRFKEYCKPLNVDLYFSHIACNYSKIAKGLDDLIVHPKTNRDKLAKELTSFTTGKREYVECFNISDNAINHIYEYFGLNNAKAFYDKHKDVIQEREFIWNKNKYYHNGERLKVSWYGQAAQYMRVGTNYYKIGSLINSHGKVEEHIIDWTISEINRDYGKNKEFFSQIPKYDVFCNIPDHTENYQKVIAIEKGDFKTVAYNRYYKLDHELKEGSFSTIEMFLKHIANSKNLSGENLYPFLLDWIQISYINPTQRLPVLCLVSKERNTGKSTFLELLQLIFKENATILDNERFTGKFTSHYITKLIIAVDESFIPIEQKLMKERIKNLATGRRQWIEAKSKNAQEIDFFGKLVLTSNDESNFMQIDIGENRHCVLKINKLEHDDPNLTSKMAIEIPAFLHFLKNRKLHYEGNRSRAWFDADIYKTEAVLNVMERTKGQLERELEYFISTVFEASKQPSLEFTPKYLSMKVCENLRYNVPPTKIIDYLKDRGMKPQGVKRFVLYNEDGTIQDFNVVGSPYLFDRKDWIKSE